MRQRHLYRLGFVFAVCALVTLSLDDATSAQEPADWGEDLIFHTFSIAAVDPLTGESGVAVTTRVACVGNGVPWVRAGVGAVATQASTRTEYGAELLDMLEEGISPAEALATALAADPGANRRQVGVVALDGRAAQHRIEVSHLAARMPATVGHALQMIPAIQIYREAILGEARPHPAPVAK